MCESILGRKMMQHAPTWLIAGKRFFSFGCGVN